MQEYVKKCDVCQRNKYQTMSPAGLLQSLPIPKQIWADISMISLEPGGKDTIMVVVHRFTKYAHFLA